MKRQKVKSSNLASIGYDETTGVLEVEFHGGAVYSYADVPAKVVKELMTAPSLGSFFAKSIRPHFKAERVPEKRPKEASEPAREQQGATGATPREPVAPARLSSGASSRMVKAARTVVVPRGK